MLRCARSSVAISSVVVAHIIYKREEVRGVAGFLHTCGSKQSEAKEASSRLSSEQNDDDLQEDGYSDCRHRTAGVAATHGGNRGVNISHRTVQLQLQLSPCGLLLLAIQQSGGKKAT
jgi:hypothetical protein